MEIIIVSTVALIGSLLSFFCGFGLGTLLLPAFLLFFPMEVAIAATAIVHMLNNVFKLFLVGKHAQKEIIIGFGGLSMVGALLGALSLTLLADVPTISSWNWGEHAFEVTPVKLMIGVVMLVFALLELSPRMQSIQLPKGWLPLGGLISGYFGGLSGHQGALRSAFLMKAGLTKEAFMGNRVVIASMVDLTRITVYIAAIGAGWSQIDPITVGIAALAAFLGAFWGNKFMHKTELAAINRIVTISLIIFAIALGAGVI